LEFLLSNDEMLSIRATFYFKIALRFLNLSQIVAWILTSFKSKRSLKYPSFGPLDLQVSTRNLEDQTWPYPSHIKSLVMCIYNTITIHDLSKQGGGSYGKGLQEDKKGMRWMCLVAHADHAKV